MTDIDIDEYQRLCDQYADWLSGWSSTHDYDPTWDYTVAFEHRDHPLYRLACEAAERVCAAAATNQRIPFADARVYPVHLDGDVVAVYVSGTSSEPVVLVDIARHEAVEDPAEQRTAICDSVIHELRHACQEAYELPACEDEAEYGSSRLPF